MRGSLINPSDEGGLLELAELCASRVRRSVFSISKSWTRAVNRWTSASKLSINAFSSPMSVVSITRTYGQIAYLNSYDLCMKFSTIGLKTGNCLGAILV